MTASLLARAHDTLEAAGIAHALVGAAALAVHGVSRSTFDRDLLVWDPRALEPDTWNVFAASAGVDIRRGDADDPLAGVIRLTQDGERDVDVIVGRHAWQRRLTEDATIVSTPDGPLPVVSPAGLVLLKLYAGGPQDLWDIQQLRAIAGPGLDDAVRAAIAPLPAPARATWDALVARNPQA